MYNDSDAIGIGACDRGPVRFTSKKSATGLNKVVEVSFYSSNTEAPGMPATCTINWNATYKNPKHYGNAVDQSPLSSCFTLLNYKVNTHAQKRKSPIVLLKYFWFFILDWEYRK
ncbi:unnamed protein product [Owenia fusiformis]|uniref:Uncharacterized protein n=1 Tax=Owenia fusiformis TaxID=6347 RepID=A0A8S4Q7G0_OWEFU|nr:unnamed protein product [Owenia fusiformis]